MDVLTGRPVQGLWIRANVSYTFLGPADASLSCRKHASGLQEVSRLELTLATEPPLGLMLTPKDLCRKEHEDRAGSRRGKRPRLGGAIQISQEDPTTERPERALLRDRERCVGRTEELLR